MLKKSSLLFLFLCFLFTGCGSDTDDIVTSDTSSGSGSAGTTTGGGTNGGSGTGGTTTGGTGTGDAATLRQVDANVSLPSGMGFDLTGTTVVSQLATFDVAGDGSTTVLLQENGRVLAILFDSGEQPILVGFLTENQRSIDVESTVKASIYLGLGTFLLPAEIREPFWDGVTTFPGYTSLVADAETLFRNDPLFLQGTAYRDLISGYLSSLLASEQLGINARLILDSTIRSGLQLQEVSGDAVSFINSKRRRAHAFIYKLRYTDSADVVHEFIDEDNLVEANPQSFTDFFVSPASAFGSFVGTLQSAASGKGLEFFAKESGPVDLSLGPGEKEAVYVIRVVGPSTQVLTPLTAAEFSKVNRLSLETMAVDFLLPLILMGIGEDDKTSAVLPNFAANESLVDATQLIVTSVPGMEDSLKKGAYQQALVEFFDALFDGLLASQIEPLVQSFVNLVVADPSLLGPGSTEANAKRIASSTEKLLTVLKATDIILQGADWSRINQGIASAKLVEDFEITVTQNKVTLVPPEAAALQGIGKSIKAVIQDGAATLGDGEAFEYRWSTTGTYGILRDEVGHSGTSFSTSRDTVEYVAAGGSIPEDAVDEITVEIVIVGPNPTVPVGEPSEPAKFHVRPLAFEIYPDNLEVQGGQSVTLGLRLSDGTNPFNSNFFDYELVWETAGQFGLFDGVTTGLTETTKNTVSYEALDKENDGTETVSVSIYSKPKGSQDRLSFLDRVSATIEINNDPNIRIFYVTNTQASGSRLSLNGVTFVWFVHTVFDFPPMEDAEHYQLTIVEYSPDSTPSQVGTGTSWTAGDPDDLVDGVYRHTTARSSGSANSDNLAERLANSLAFHKTIQGLAKVVVTLKAEP